MRAYVILNTCCSAVKLSKVYDSLKETSIKLLLTTEILALESKRNIFPEASLECEEIVEEFWFTEFISGTKFGLSF